MYKVLLHNDLIWSSENTADNKAGIISSILQRGKVNFIGACGYNLNTWSLSLELPLGHQADSTQSTVCPGLVFLEPEE